MTLRLHQAPWPSADLVARLADRDAVVCSASLHEFADELDATVELLAPSERERFASYTNAVVARRYACGRRLVREMLGVALGVSPRDVALRDGEHGKPCLAGPAASRFWFSVSHTDDLLLVAMSRRLDVGVDVERVRAFEQWQRVAERVLDARELGELQRAVNDGGDPGATFLRHWCRVEAELKAVGCGIHGLDAHRAGERPRGLEVVDLGVIALPAGLPEGATYLGAIAACSPGATYPALRPSASQSAREAAQATTPVTSPASASTA